jgi:hypothetical protein
MVTRSRFSLMGAIYIIVGLVVAVTHHYITAGLFTRLLSALLAIALWPLPLLGIDLHIH